jgi:DHA1 family multidrug resistance protein-like MFS transporter
MQSASWRKNLYVVAASEFIVLLAFTCYTPFIPLYIQQLGGLTREETALWAGIAIGGGGISMFLSAPIWGMVADRWGRKPMLLRAQIGGAVMVALFAIAPNIYAFVGLRILTGIFTGTVSAALALVATLTPRDKTPFAMGVLMAAVYSGMTVGPLVGGFMADNFGFKTTFIVISILLLMGSLVILCFIEEKFQRPTQDQRTSPVDLIRLAVSPDMVPLLIVIAILHIGPQMISPVLPLIISELNSTGATATSSGLAFALIGIISAVSSLVAARLHGRFSIQKILVFCCLGTGLLYIPPIWASSATQLILLVGITGLLIGGIITSSNSLIGMKVPITQQGIAYGLSQSATALGMGLGPFFGGGFASVMGLRPVFGVTAGVFIIASILVMKLLSKKALKPQI